MRRADVDSARIAAVAKALGEPLRVEIFDILLRSEQSVCQCELQELLGISQSLLSHHMRRLVDAELVEAQRRHRWVHYTPSRATAEVLAAWLS